MRYLLFGLGILILALAAACDDNDDDEGAATATPGNGGPTSSATGPGISIAEARASDLAGPLLINGFLVVRDAEAHFCEALAESYPPQCAGDSLEVENLDLDALEGLTTAEGVTWSDNAIQLLGTVEGDTLVVERNASA